MNHKQTKLCVGINEFRQRRFSDAIATYCVCLSYFCHAVIMVFLCSLLLALSPLLSLADLVDCCCCCWWWWYFLYYFGICMGKCFFWQFLENGMEKMIRTPIWQENLNKKAQRQCVWMAYKTPLAGWPIWAEPNRAKKIRSAPKKWFAIKWNEGDKFQLFPFSCHSLLSNFRQVNVFGWFFGTFYTFKQGQSRVPRDGTTVFLFVHVKVSTIKNNNSSKKN